MSATLLRAMARNYANGHCWDHLDGEACLKSADLIEEQQKRIAESCEDSLRLIASIKYLRGIAEKGEQREQRDDETVEQFVLGYVVKLEKQLTAAKARIKVLREALENVEGALDESGMYQDYPVTYDLVLEALAQPTDDSALRELLKAERERIAQRAEAYAYMSDNFNELAREIRAMGSES